MGFKDKYTNTDKKTKNPDEEEGKLELPVEYFAVCELLDNLNRQLNRLAVKLWAGRSRLVLSL